MLVFLVDGSADPIKKSNDEDNERKKQGQMKAGQAGAQRTNNLIDKERMELRRIAYPPGWAGLWTV